MLRGVDDAPAQAALLQDAAARLGQALALDANELYERLATKHRFVWIKRRVIERRGRLQSAPSAIRRSKCDPIRGLAIEGEGHRYYPGRELAGPLLGFVAPDGQGKDGIELSLDDELRGHVEEVHGLRDRTGQLIFCRASRTRTRSQGTTSR